MTTIAQRIAKTALLIISLCICFLPLLPGLTGLFFSALGYIPAINQYQFSIDGFTQLANWPGLSQSIGLSLFVGLGSTLLATLGCFMILQSCWQQPIWRKLELFLSPILALPHVAFAIGFAFIFSPSGFIARIFAQFIEDFTASDWSLINDPYALGLLLALTLKEIPFLLFMSIALLKQLNLEKTMLTGQSLGYSPAQVWQKIIFPQWLPKIRFSLFAIAAYSISVVDVALVLGPTQPPTLPVLVWQWLNDADLATLPKASAGAVLLLVLCVFVLALLRAMEWLLIAHCRHWQTQGRFALPILGKPLLAIIGGITFIIMPLLLLWSLAQRWRFPDWLPSQFSLRFWQQEWDYLYDIICTSTLIALLSASLALLFAIVIHEHNNGSHKAVIRIKIPKLIILIPMLAPQLSLLFGIQVATLLTNSSAHLLWVIWAHVFFVFPYIYLALDGPWRSYDKRLDKVALSLGMSPLRAWWKVKRPILLPAIWIAWALGISVSLTQYLPTLMLGAGRITTLTTEAVALASGQDRRIGAIYALLQSLLPIFFYLVAIIASSKSGHKLSLNHTHSILSPRSLIKRNSALMKNKNPFNSSKEKPACR